MAGHKDKPVGEELVVIELTYDQAAVMLDLLVDLACIEEQENREMILGILTKVQQSSLEPIKEAS